MHICININIYICSSRQRSRTPARTTPCGTPDQPHPPSALIPCTQHPAPHTMNRERRQVVNPIVPEPESLNLKLLTLHPTPYTLHPTPSTLKPKH
jgi:hypothetical protein